MGGGQLKKPEHDAADGRQGQMQSLCPGRMGYPGEPLQAIRHIPTALLFFCWMPGRCRIRRGVQPLACSAARCYNGWQIKRFRSLPDTDTDEGKRNGMNIQINQLGYTPGMKKTAVLRGQLADVMTVVNAAGETVLTVPVGAQRCEIWGDDAAHADFSALTQPGVYTLHCGDAASHPFAVADAPYAA